MRFTASVVIQIAVPFGVACAECITIQVKAYLSTVAVIRSQATAAFRQTLAFTVLSGEANIPCGATSFFAHLAFHAGLKNAHRTAAKLLTLPISRTLAVSTLRAAFIGNAGPATGVVAAAPRIWTLVALFSALIGNAGAEVCGGGGGGGVEAGMRSATSIVQQIAVPFGVACTECTTIQVKAYLGTVAVIRSQAAAAYGETCPLPFGRILRVPAYLVLFARVEFVQNTVSLGHTGSQLRGPAFYGLAFTFAF